jgi:hypothetical protein
VTSVLSDQLRDYGVDYQRLWVDAAGRLMRPGSCDNLGAIVVCKQGVRGSSPLGSTPLERSLPSRLVRVRLRVDLSHELLEGLDKGIARPVDDVAVVPTVLHE